MLHFNPKNSILKSLGAKLFHSLTSAYKCFNVEEDTVDHFVFTNDFTHRLYTFN